MRRRQIGVVTGKPKNLLVIISDEHRRDAMGVAGHAIVQTPHLDALAARGTRFTNAYTPSPMCVPARAALACGDYVHRIRHWDSATPYDGTHRSWMHRLGAAGLPVTSIGKLHFRSGDDDTGFAEEILPMHVVGGIGWTVGLLREDPPHYPAAAELAADVGTGETSYTRYDRSITASAEDWLGAKRGETTPWAAFVSLVSPHYPLSAPKAFAHLYNAKDMSWPIAYAPKDRPTHPEIQRLATFFDYDSHFDSDQVRSARAAYFGLVSFMDASVGRILAALDESGQAEETLVIYTSDHGEMLGDHGLWTKQVMYEGSSGVPMVLAGPGVAKGKSVGTAVSLLDIAATAFDVAGIDQAGPGASLVDLASAPDDRGRAVLSEYHDGGSTTGAFMLRWDRWKYVYYPGGPPQLFDLDADPDERIDRADEPSAFAALKEGDARLRAICDPDAVNRQCFADQRRKIDALGGRAACLGHALFNHTPVPNDVGAISRAKTADREA